MHRKHNSGDVSASELASLRPEQYFCATEAFGADSENASGDEHKSTRTNESDSTDLGVSAHRRALPHAPRAMKSRARSQSVRCLRRAHYSSSLARTRSRVMMKRLLVEETMSISDITPGPLPNTPAERRRERTPHRPRYLRKKCTSPSLWIRPQRLEWLERLSLQSHPAHPVINHCIQDDKQVFVEPSLAEVDDLPVHVGVTTRGRTKEGQGKSLPSAATHLCL